MPITCSCVCVRERKREGGGCREGGDERFRVLKTEEDWLRRKEDTEVAAFHSANWDPLKVACKGSVAGVLLLIYLW